MRTADPEYDRFTIIDAKRCLFSFRLHFSKAEVRVPNDIRIFSTVNSGINSIGFFIPGLPVFQAVTVFRAVL